jgi:hypothetical protein
MRVLKTSGFLIFLNMHHQCKIMLTQHVHGTDSLFSVCLLVHFSCIFSTWPRYIQSLPQQPQGGTLVYNQLQWKYFNRIMCCKRVFSSIKSVHRPTIFFKLKDSSIGLPSASFGPSLEYRWTLCTSSNLRS